MTIRYVAMLFIALVALSACKAVTLQEATVSQPTFGTEAEDWGIPATDQLRQDAVHAPTPVTHPAATVITTKDLHAKLIGPNPPVTINVVFSTNEVISIPGSIWLPAAGRGGTFDDDIQTQLESTLQKITDDDLARPIVVFCRDAHCWLSYNAAPRLHELGYENLYWYRGGINGWMAAELPTRMTTPVRARTGLSAS